MEPSEMEQEIKLDKLKSFLRANNMPILQENGQRTVGPPLDWKEPVPLRGSEIFIKHIPRDMIEHEILPIFMHIGKVYLFRLMMDFSGSNRGYAFLQYSDSKTAKKAVMELNSYPIRRGVYLRVSLSIDNQRLFLGRIDKHLGKEDILNRVSQVVDGVSQVIMYKSPSNKSLNRGFCFIDFDSHKHAALARRTLVSAECVDLQLGTDLKIDWAIPEDQVDEDVMKLVSTLYLRNLMLHTSEEALTSLVELFVSREKITRIRKVNDFAFVHFMDRETAEMAKRYLDKYVLDGCEIEACWARPPRKESSTNHTPGSVSKTSIQDKKSKTLLKRSSKINEKAVVPVMSSFNSESKYSEMAVPLKLQTLHYDNFVDYCNYMTPYQALSKIVEDIGWGTLDATVYSHTNNISDVVQYSASIKLNRHDYCQEYQPCVVLFHTPEEACNGASLEFVQKYFRPLTDSALSYMATTFQTGFTFSYAMPVLYRDQ